MAILTMLAKHRFYKNDGSLNSGGKVYTYVAGTSTPVDTYTDSTGTIPNTNPVILDSKGEASIWTSGLLKVNVLESDNTQVTGFPVDNVGSGVSNNDATMRYSGTAGGTANALTISPSPSITSYVIGQSFVFKAGSSNNSGATTIAISGLSPIAIQSNGAACVGGEILANMWYKIVMSTTAICQIDKLGRPTLAELGAAALAGSASQVFSVANGTGSQAINKTQADGLYSPITGTDAPKLNDFRLTLTSGLPVTTADVTGATNVYMTPYVGNRIALYTSGVWTLYTTAQVTLALGTLTAALPYDVFVFDNAGTVTLTAVAWTNATTRATALAYQDGVLCKIGALGYRYLGTFYTTSTTTTEDSYSKRFLWNYYHRKDRPLKRNESTASWTYTTATWRQANGAAANQVEAVIGVAEDAVEMETSCAMSNASAGIQVGTGVGVDSTTANSSSLSGTSTAASSCASNATSKYREFPAAGYHYFAWLEYSTATGTTTWTAFNGTLLAGIIGKIRG